MAEFVAPAQNYMTEGFIACGNFKEEVDYDSRGAFGQEKNPINKLKIVLCRMYAGSKQL